MARNSYELSFHRPQPLQFLTNLSIEVTIKREKHLQVEEFQLPSGYDYITVCHGKIHHFLKGKPSISMGHLYHGYVE